MKKNKNKKEKLVFVINGWKLTENQARVLFNKINNKLPLPIVTVKGKKSKYVYEKNNIDVFFD